MNLAKYIPNMTEIIDVKCNVSILLLPFFSKSNGQQKLKYNPKFSNYK